MFKREVKKIRELTDKLISQGDVTEDEADCVYMIYRAVRIDAENVAEGFTEGDEDRLVSVQMALSEWYEAVFDVLRSGRSGNFISSVPADTKDTRLAKILSGQEKTIFVKELPDVSRTLLGDVTAKKVSDGYELSFSRFGIKDRLSKGCGIEKELSLLRKLAEKPKGTDLTPEEADLAFSVLQTVQYLHRKRRLSGDISRIYETVNMWFQRVLNGFPSDRNFASTVPLAEIMSETDELHNRCLAAMSDEDRVNYFVCNKEVDFIGVDYVGYFPDASLELFPRCFYSQRAGIVSLLADKSTHVSFKTSSEHKALFLMRTTDSLIVMNDYDYAYTVLVPKDRERIARHVLSADDEEIDRRAEISDLYVDEFLFETVFEKERCEMPEDDSWVDITR